ncbi:MAG: DUF1667 domain-containing protein [Firmicutes bacterium]|nr:DUF1667 domain-containing protein [Bacillota bacterium]
MADLVCVICPGGCRLSAGDAIGGRGVAGARCPRGMEFARSEMGAPSRVFTGTVRVSGGALPVVPVRTNKPIGRGLLSECSRVLAGLTVSAPVGTGQVLLPDVLGTGADVIATCSVEAARRGC